MLRPLSASSFLQLKSWAPACRVCSLPPCTSLPSSSLLGQLTGEWVGRVQKGGRGGTHPLFLTGGWGRIVWRLFSSLSHWPGPNFCLQDWWFWFPCSMASPRLASLLSLSLLPSEQRASPGLPPPVTSACLPLQGFLSSGHQLPMWVEGHLISQIITHGGSLF